LGVGGLDFVISRVAGDNWTDATLVDTNKGVAEACSAAVREPSEATRARVDRNVTEAACGSLTCNDCVVDLTVVVTTAPGMAPSPRPRKLRRSALVAAMSVTSVMDTSEATKRRSAPSLLTAAIRALIKASWASGDLTNSVLLSEATLCAAVTEMTTCSPKLGDEVGCLLGWDVGRLVGCPEG